MDYVDPVELFKPINIRFIISSSEYACDISLLIKRKCKKCKLNVFDNNFAHLFPIHKLLIANVNE